MTYLVTAWSTCQDLPGVEEHLATMAQVQRLVHALASKPHIAYITIRIIPDIARDQIGLDLRE